MAHRVDDSDLRVTHTWLSLILGVRRPGVSLALAALEGRGLIRATRTRIKIRDRDGLRAVANGFYGVAEAEYQRLIGSLAGEARLSRPPYSATSFIPANGLDSSSTPTVSTGAQRDEEHQPMSGDR